MPPLVSQNIFPSSSNPRIFSTFQLKNNCKHHLKPHRFQYKLPQKQFSNSYLNMFNHAAKLIKFKSAHQRISTLNAVYDSGEAFESKKESIDTIKFESLLYFIEFVCLVSSIAVSVCYLVNYGGLKVGGKVVFGWLGNGVMVWQWVVLVVGFVVGTVIRRRQWMRICNVNIRGRREGEVVSLVDRIEKLEEDLRNSTTIVRVLSRQLEKLGIRFRIHKKALKEPISETAALAQKNSEATRALTEQGDHLEQELGEIQKVLMAMQEQQRKQLELILAIAKSGNLLESKKEPIRHQGPTPAAPNLAADGAPLLEFNQQ
ncbi:hypothetical protein Leryth_006441 [Lithospermum erythrorhizon]|nr:hypothetical protein Leryth_006441 [Lithospermum erythrorhizon]